MEEEDKYLLTKKRVAKIRNFYNHLQIFVIIMLVILFFSNTIFTFFENHIQNPNTLKWARANIWVNTLLWFLGLVIHGLYAFKYKISFLNTWRQRKINQFMNENN